MFFDAKTDSLPMLLSSVEPTTMTAPAPEAAPQAQALRQPEVPFVVGVDLGGTQTRAAVVRGDEIIARVSRTTPANDGPAAVVAAIVATVHAALEKAEIGLTGHSRHRPGGPRPVESHHRRRL